MAEFDKLAADYRRTLGKTSWISGADPEFFLNQRLSWVGRLERPAGLILDLGCGIGMAAQAFEQHFPHDALLGVDPSRESIEVARQQRSRMRFEVSGARIPVESGAAGLVHASGVLHHVQPDARDALLAEVRRVLAPSGLFVIFENSPFHPVMRTAMWINPIDARAWPVWPGPIQRRLARAGFLVEEVRWLFAVPGSSDLGRRLDQRLSHLPFGSQYAVLARLEQRFP